MALSAIALLAGCGSAPSLPQAETSAAAVSHNATACRVVRKRGNLRVAIEV